VNEKKYIYLYKKKAEISTEKNNEGAEWPLFRGIFYRCDIIIISLWDSLGGVHK